jgi:hypothetical protein
MSDHVSTLPTLKREKVVHHLAKDGIIIVVKFIKEESES